MAQNVITVSGLTKYIKSILESDLRLANFTVSGEISNLTIHRTGHLYFAIKDESAVINAVMFRGCVSGLKFKPENGMKIIAKGKITVFEPAGRYQILVTSMEVDGIGDLYVAYEQLKKKLDAEGLFSKEHKKLLPKLPRKIGVITSPTGAAIRDIINVLERRFPLAEVLLYPSLVQGDGAPSQLINALKYFENTKCVDVVIIGRGGGSIEDLWAFNNEELARYIYGMSVPVISAVGHEIDFTICDFVSDVRAPTPSAAAELAVPDTNEMLTKFDNVNKRLKLLLKRKLDQYEQSFITLLNSRIFTNADFFTEQRQLLLDHTIEKLFGSFDNKINSSESAFSKVTAKLDALSPLKVMSRGYLFARNDDGKIVKSVNDVQVDDKLLLKLCDGSAVCIVDNVESEAKYER